MRAPTPVTLSTEGPEHWAADLPTVRQGVYQTGQRMVDYVLLQPAPDQWVVMAMVAEGCGEPRALIVVDGASEAEAFLRLAQRLHQTDPPVLFDAFATDWAMNAVEC